ncbi:MAG: GAF domain-containing sensor histidine kinase, partial [Anaerolineales bacterium]|nr:GAF domain-containing sensor histidine kinase [Anaerolineales bacterium]
LAGASGWEVRSARRLTPGDRQTVLAEPIGILAQAIADRTAVVSRQPAEDPALASMSALRVCREVACAPLTRGGKPGGALLVGWNEPGAASSHVLAELQAIGRLTSAGLDGLDRLQRAETEKQRQGEVQEESRKRLARDLHDGPTQAVASLAMRLNYIGKLVERDPAAARRELTTAEEMARRATRDIRHMLFALRPLILESQGLVPALWQLGKKVHEVQGEQVLVEAERQDAENMSPLQQSVIFYIAEEAINNAVKHAQAQHIWVRLRPGASDWRLEIEDDGVGFNVGSVDEDYAQRGSLGLVNMRERAALAGGQLQVFSQEGSGTRILASIPRQAEAGADV